MVENCCKSLYASPRVRQTGFEMQAWSGACKEDGEQNQTTIAIKSQMADLEVIRTVWPIQSVWDTLAGPGIPGQLQAVFTNSFLDCIQNAFLL